MTKHETVNGELAAIFAVCDMVKAAVTACQRDQVHAKRVKWRLIAKDLRSAAKSATAIAKAEGTAP
jgi:hypothetical protein